MKPYFAVNKTVYFTDRIEEVVIYTDEREDVAERISDLLNDTYIAAYQDGLNASLDEQYNELLNKVQSLFIENLRLKRQLDLNREQ